MLFKSNLSNLCLMTQCIILLEQHFVVGAHEVHELGGKDHEALSYRSHQSVTYFNGQVDPTHHTIIKPPAACTLPYWKLCLWPYGVCSTFELYYQLEATGTDSLDHAIYCQSSRVQLIKLWAKVKFYALYHGVNNTSQWAFCSHML